MSALELGANENAETRQHHESLTRQVRDELEQLGGGPIEQSSSQYQSTSESGEDGSANTSGVSGVTANESAKQDEKFFTPQ
jgi:hypothetical protein